MTGDIKNDLIDDDFFGLHYQHNLSKWITTDILKLPFYMMALPQFLSGISIFFVQFTSIEFILA